MSLPRGETVTLQQRIAQKTCSLWKKILGKFWVFRGHEEVTIFSGEGWQTLDLQTASFCRASTPGGSIWVNHGGSQELKKSPQKIWKKHVKTYITSLKRGSSMSRGRPHHPSISVQIGYFPPFFGRFQWIAGPVGDLVRFMENLTPLIWPWLCCEPSLQALLLAQPPSFCMKTYFLVIFGLTKVQCCF